MNRALRNCSIISTEVGSRTLYLNRRSNCADNMGIGATSLCVNPPGVDTSYRVLGHTAVKANEAPCDIRFVRGDFKRNGGRLLTEWASKTQAAGWRLHIENRDHLEVYDPRIIVYNELGANDPRLKEFYRNADIIVLTTVADCYSIAAIEALYFGLPIILSETRGTGDGMRCSKTGYLMQPNDISQMCATMEELIGYQAHRHAIGDAGRLGAIGCYCTRKKVRFDLDRIKELV